MVLPGDVVHYKNFNFRDGGQADKYFIVLCAPVPPAPCLLTILTSQEWHYPGSNIGCNVSMKVFVVPDGTQKSLTQKSYIKLDHIYDIPFNNMYSRVQTGVITGCGSLPPTCFTDLLACLKHFKKDIPVVHFNLLFSKS
jgi:hypothetical protein